MDNETKLIWETFTDGSPANNPSLAAGGMRNEDDIDSEESEAEIMTGHLLRKLDNGHHPVVEYEDDDGRMEVVKQATIDDYDHWGDGTMVFFGNGPDGEEVQLQSHHILNILS
jgi:hypothetical protein